MKKTFLTLFSAVSAAALGFNATALAQEDESAVLKAYEEVSTAS
jgi:hypothetical protein